MLVSCPKVEVGEVQRMMRSLIQLDCGAHIYQL